MDIAELIDDCPGDNSVSGTMLDPHLEPLGPCCDKCGAALTAKDSLVCQKCGWYASIGSYVEIDKSWEVASNPDLASEEDQPTAPPTRLPTWAWILMGCVVGVIVESVAARLLTADGSAVRTFWSLSQLLVGAVAWDLPYLQFRVGDEKRSRH